jgi:hypothetical protein
LLVIGNQSNFDFAQCPQIQVGRSAFFIFGKRSPLTLTVHPSA